MLQSLVICVLVVLVSRTYGQFQLGFGTPTPVGPKTYDPNCRDVLSNCWDFPISSCQAPYVQWATDNCPNRCGICLGPTTAAPPCVDTLPNCDAYDKSICSSSDYKNWASKNCKLFCRMCPAAVLAQIDASRTTSTISPANCKDKTDCRLYGPDACTGKYRDWAKVNCPAHCNFCQPLPTAPPVCADKIPNCKQYDADTCTNPMYNLWVEDNCRSFCGKCSGVSTIAYNVPSPPAPPGKKRSTPCADTIPNCAGYGVGICQTDVYRAWAQAHCAGSCNFCTPEVACVDKNDKCNEYDDGALCISEDYYAWAKLNCLKYCKFPPCGSSGVSTIAYNVPSPSAPLGKKRSNAVKRQFDASHHHNGESNKCWDNNSNDPDCINISPPAVQSTVQPVVESSTADFPGSDIRPNHKPPPDWDSKPSSGVSVATSQTKLPVDTTTETLTSMSTKTSVSGITDIGTQSTGSPSTPTPGISTTTTAEAPLTPSANPDSTTVTQAITTTADSTTNASAQTVTTQTSGNTVSTTITGTARTLTLNVSSATEPSTSTRSTVSVPVTKQSVNTTTSKITMTVPLSTEKSSPPDQTPPTQATKTDSSSTTLPTPASTWNVSTACFGSDFHCSNYKLECSPNQEISIISASYGTKQHLPESLCIFGVSDCIVGAACCVFNASDKLTPFSYADSTRLNQNCKGRSMCEAAAPRLGVAPFSSYVYINYTCSNSTYTISVSQQDSAFTPPTAKATDITPKNNSPVTQRPSLSNSTMGVPPTLAPSKATESTTTTSTTPTTPTTTMTERRTPSTTATTPTTTTMQTTTPCADTIPNCAGYGVGMCQTAVYRAWAQAHCAASCNFCTPEVACVDKNDKCNEYDDGLLCISENYYAWAKENCLKYCKFPPCGNNTIHLLTKPQTTPSTIATTTEKSNCTDVLDNCIYYPDEKCVGIYKPWATAHCAKRCGYCNESLPCVDNNPDCDKYPPGICTDASYTGWARQNCRQFCNLCQRPTQPPTDSSHPSQQTNTPGIGPTGTPPTPASPVKSAEPSFMSHMTVVPTSSN